MSVPANLMTNVFQGMSPTGAFMGAPNSIQGGIPNGGLLSQLAQEMAQGGQMGPWSQLAYQMAGSPLQGPYPSVAPPSGTGISGAGAAGGGIGGLLSSISQNPSLAKNLGQAVSGLMSPAVGTPAWDAALTSGESAAIPAASAIAAPTAADVAASIGAPASGALYGGAQAGADAGLAAGSYPTSVGGATVIGGDTTAAGAGGASGASGAGTSALGTAAAAALPAAIAGLSFADLFGAFNDGLPQGASFVDSLQGAAGWSPQFKQAAQQAYNQLGEAGFYQWLAQNYSGIAGAHAQPSMPATVKPI